MQKIVCGPLKDPPASLIILIFPAHPIQKKIEKSHIRSLSLSLSPLSSPYFLSSHPHFPATMGVAMMGGDGDGDAFGEW